jgi:hypothetical protein
MASVTRSGEFSPIRAISHFGQFFENCRISRYLGNFFLSISYELIFTKNVSGSIFKNFFFTNLSGHPDRGKVQSTTRPSGSPSPRCNCVVRPDWETRGDLSLKGFESPFQSLLLKVLNFQQWWVRLLHIAKPQLSNEAGSEHGCQCYNKF